MSKWKKVYIAFLALFAIGGIIMKDYVVTGFLVTSNAAFLLEPKRSRRSKLAQLALLSIAIIVGAAYLYLKVKAAKE